MSWKSRKKKAYERYIERLKESPIYLIGEYLLIEERHCIRYRKEEKTDSYQSYIKRHKEELREGRIKTSLDFDCYHNPDLNLNPIPFEKDKNKLNKLIQGYLREIGKRWSERIKNMFPGHVFTLVMYCDHLDEDMWLLDFKNGKFIFKVPSDDKRFTDIEYIG